MAESRRLESSPAPDHADRDGRVETLLLRGLDRYFAGRYEEAIHVWTRVLFVDRSHARARAYIDRARSAVAERQRRAEEMLHASHDLMRRGDTAAARDLLAEAVAVTGDDDQASALRLRLEREERAVAAARIGRSASLRADPVPGWTWPRRSWTAAGALVALGAALLLVMFVSSAPGRQWLAWSPSTSPMLTTRPPVRLESLSATDIALVRARTLFARGRLAEALQALDRVGPESPSRVEADDLRIRIQALLLAGSVRGPTDRLPR